MLHWTKNGVSSEVPDVRSRNQLPYPSQRVLSAEAFPVHSPQSLVWLDVAAGEREESVGAARGVVVAGTVLPNPAGLIPLLAVGASRLIIEGAFGLLALAGQPQSVNAGSRLHIRCAVSSVRV
jgi:hypothetical protein